ncbi:prolyl oligopeptidase family serine peptidase [Micromonospora sp. NPDC048835]|uniref:prolyl oligopeptidase family serine peptidase n=1 Tax=Micromonospora sp. NPDC048835 TaxID=3155147 RepID=UPI00340A6C15
MPDCLLSADGNRIVYVAADARGWPTTLRVRDLDRRGPDRTVLVSQGGAGSRLRIRRASNPAYILVADGVRSHWRVTALELAALNRPPTVLPRATSLERCDVGLWRGAPLFCELSTDAVGDTHLTVTTRSPIGDRRHTRRLGRIGTPEDLRATDAGLLVRATHHSEERVLRFPLLPTPAARDEILVHGPGRFDLSLTGFAESVGCVVLERCAGQTPGVHAWDRTGSRLAVADSVPALAPPALARKDVMVAADNARVPVSLAWSPTTNTAGFTGPLVLFVYGAYGVRLSLDGIDGIRALTDAGLAVGVVGVRGGGGPDGWHEAGRGPRRHVSVSDLRAAVKHLRGGSEPGIKVTALGLVGASAGGFLVGAALNQFGADVDVAVMTNGFLDPIPTLLDDTSPLTASDRDEWGDLRRCPRAYRALAELSPYRNLTTCLTTKTLLLVSDGDRQVSPAQSLKWCLRARALGSDVELWYFPDSGHSRMSGGPRATTAVHGWLVTA